MDAIKAAFESQFGTEWSTPVVNHNTDKPESNELDELESNNSEESEDEQPIDGKSEAEEGPITVKHDELNVGSTQPIMSKAQRRRFMSNSAPQDDQALDSQRPKDKAEHEDLQNDLALQRLIEESHILGESSKDQQFSGADISGVIDPLEHAGKTRLKIIESRLAKAGAKKSSQKMPQAMAVGIRDRQSERKQKYKAEAREAGIITAKEKHIKSKHRMRDKGLKINTVGKASEHGIHVTAAEIARVSGKSRVTKGKRRHR